MLTYQDISFWRMWPPDIRWPAPAACNTLQCHLEATYTPSGFLLGNMLGWERVVVVGIKRNIKSVLCGYNSPLGGKHDFISGELTQGLDWRCHSFENCPLNPSVFSWGAGCHRWTPLLLHPPTDEKAKYTVSCTFNSMMVSANFTDNVCITKWTLRKMRK